MGKPRPFKPNTTRKRPSSKELLKSTAPTYQLNVPWKAIRDDFVQSEKGMTLIELARKHEVSPGQVYNKAAYEKWRELRKEWWDQVCEESEKAVREDLVRSRVRRVKDVGALFETQLKRMRKLDTVSVQDLFRLLQLEKELLDGPKRDDGGDDVQALILTQVAVMRERAGSNTRLQEVIDAGVRRLQS